MALVRIRNALRRALRQVARPAREDSGGEGLVVEAFRGYGSQREIYLMGRVYRQPGGPVAREAGDLKASLKRLIRRGARDQTVVARFDDVQQQVVTDRDGYFQVHLQLNDPPPARTPWHRVALTLRLPSGATAAAQAEVFVPPPDVRFVVISDIDDTVMWTGVANKVRMFWRLFAQGARSRVAFPGVATLYRALHGTARNPLLYVSRGPWSIYPMLEAFFQLQRIPVGPVLFLRDWGVSPRSPLPRRARDHKLTLIRRMLTLYRDLPFVLIGDSGQHDPETYAQVVREHPGRVLAVYIRNVSHDADRTAAIATLAEEVLSAGSSLLLASDSVAMAEHAAEAGLVAAETPQLVAQEREVESGRTARGPLRVLKRATRAQGREAVEDGRLEETLQEGRGDRQDEQAPPNTLVESETLMESEKRR